jgi:redox-regulated HSP33 family molecular chaperone
LIARAQAKGLDMLIASRLQKFESGSFRMFHHWGNKLISKAVSVLFSARITDVLSGYRVISRQLLKVVRVRSGGFEVETEMTLQALAKGFRVEEMPVPYGSRPAGSHSKLDTWGDGLVILRCLFLIFKDYRPLLFFSTAAAVIAATSLLAGLGPIIEYVETGLVNKVPRAVLAAGLAVLATISLAVGLILDTIARYHDETISLWRHQLAEMDKLRSNRRQDIDPE